MIQLNETQSLLLTAVAAGRGSTPEKELNAWINTMVLEVLGQRTGQNPAAKPRKVSKGRKLSEITKAKISATVNEQHKHSMSRKCRDAIKDTQPGQVTIIPVSDMEEAYKMRSILTSVASRIWGNKTYMTAIHRDRIEILRK